MEYKLTIELVPRTSWYNNVRSAVPTHVWDVIRKDCYKAAGHKCEICDDVGQNQGAKHSVECHEVWHYDDVNHIQKLVKFIALCPKCHRVKHIGLSTLNGYEEDCIRHIMKINQITRQKTKEYINRSFKAWNIRNQYKWTVDLSYLTQHYQQ